MTVCEAMRLGAVAVQVMVSFSLDSRMRFFGMAASATATRLIVGARPEWLLTVNAAVVPAAPRPSASLGVMRIITMELFVFAMSLPLAQTNVCGVPVGLEARPVVPSPWPETAVAVFQVVPPSGLYSTRMSHASEFRVRQTCSRSSRCRSAFPWG